MIGSTQYIGLLFDFKSSNCFQHTMICDALIIISSNVIYVQDVASHLSQSKLTKGLMQLQLLLEHITFESTNIFCWCSSM